MGIFLLGTTEFMLAGLLPQIAADLGVTLPRVGLLVSAFAVGMVIGAPLMTVVTLRLPRRTTLMIALLVFAASHVVAALTESFSVLLVMRVVAAFATGAFWAVGAVVVIAAVAANNQARALAVMVSGLTLANVIGVPLGTYVGNVTGWRGPFWVLAAAAVLIAVAVAVIVSTPPTQTKPSLGTEFSALREPRLWAVYAVAALAQGAVFATFSYVSPLLTDRSGLPDSAVPLVLVGFGAGALAGSTLGGRFGDRAPRATTVVALVVTTLDLALIACGPDSGWVVVPALVVLGVSAFILAPVLTNTALRLAGQAPTLASAMSTSAFNVGNTLGPWLGGLALSSGFSARGPSLVGAIMAAAALTVALGAAALGADAQNRPASRRGADL